MLTESLSSNGLLQLFVAAECVFGELLASNGLLQLFVAAECVFGELLASTGLLLWLHYSGF
jgi:hypothetical protein